MIKITPSAWARKHGFSRQYAYRLIQQGIISSVSGLLDEAQADAALAKKRATRRQRGRPQRVASGSGLATAPAGSVSVSALFSSITECLETLTAQSNQCLRLLTEYSVLAICSGHESDATLTKRRAISDVFVQGDRVTSCVKLLASMTDFLETLAALSARCAVSLPQDGGFDGLHPDPRSSASRLQRWIEGLDLPDRSRSGDDP